MKKSISWFSLIELLIYIIISSIILYWISYNINTISKIIYETDKNVYIYQELDDFQDKFEKINSDYQNFTFSSGSIFWKSESWFQICLFTNKDKSKWIVIWVINADKKLSIWNITNIEKYIPFVSEVSSWTINNILSNNNISDIILSSEIKIEYTNINMFKFSCNKKINYTKFDMVIIPKLNQNDLWEELENWNKTNFNKISLSFIK